MEALIRPNVTVFSQGINRITPRGFVNDDNVEHEVDVIICATGYVLCSIKLIVLTKLDSTPVGFLASPLSPMARIYKTCTRKSRCRISRSASPRVRGPLEIRTGSAESPSSTKLLDRRGSLRTSRSRFLHSDNRASHPSHPENYQEDAEREHQSTQAPPRHVRGLHRARRAVPQADSMVGQLPQLVQARET